MQVCDKVVLCVVPAQFNFSNGDCGVIANTPKVRTDV